MWPICFWTPHLPGGANIKQMRPLPSLLDVQIWCKYKILFEANMTKVTQIRSVLHICCCFVTHVNLFFRPVYEFTCFPNGLAFCPRKFTKLLKPVYSTLRQMGHLSVAYIDDSYLQADLYDHCVQNVIDTVTMFDKLGLVVHPEKSVLVPTQRLVFLGFILDSILMRISLTPEKACRVKNACKQLVDTVLPSIRQVAQVLGLLTSSFPGVMCGPLH